MYELAAYLNMTLPPENLDSKNFYYFYDGSTPSFIIYAKVDKTWLKANCNGVGYATTKEIIWLNELQASENPTSNGTTPSPVPSEFPHVSPIGNK